ncbi:flagellar protein FlgN [Lutispora saccharofermentans]|uniref:Flagellar protein FlgN n=1 Tax=Lutispora saccharofermentans TaxID=3024236 RepID=A0ABT1NBH4_9FIRM|nr:flagellar protein FlgN [Lutispora saccharofermentans]MCQ1528590.1 flagellar protein FlgN [Lutispora saccharofermentans]
MDNLDKIILCLENQKNIYEKLLSLSMEKKDAIIEGKVNELDNFIKLEGNLILEIGKLEDERDSTAEALARELGCSRENLTISYICNEVKDSRCDHLKQVAGSIGNTLNQLKEINDLNGELIEQSLEYINFSINLISDSMEGQNVIYEGKPEESKDNNVRLFDAKI